MQLGRLGSKLKDILFSTNKTIFIAIIIAIGLSIASPYFLTTVNLLNVLRQISVSAIVALAYTLSLASRSIDLSVGSMLGLVGGIVAISIRDFGLPIYIAIIIGLVSGVCLGLFNAVLISAFDIPPFIVTLATAALYRGLLYIMTNMAPVVGLPNTFKYIGQGYLWRIPVQVYVLIVIFIVMYVLANRTRFGRYVVAMGANMEAAHISGINIRNVRFGVYTVVGLCVGIAAVLQTARAASAQTSAGLYMEMDVIAAVVIGGTALYGGNTNIIGTIFGVFIIGIIANGLNLLGINPHFQIIGKGLLILSALIMDRISGNIRTKLKKPDLES